MGGDTRRFTRRLFVYEFREFTDSIGPLPAHPGDFHRAQVCFQCDGPKRYSNDCLLSPHERDTIAASATLSRNKTTREGTHGEKEDGKKEDQEL